MYLYINRIYKMQLKIYFLMFVTITQFYLIKIKIYAYNNNNYIFKIIFMHINTKILRN
jgi:hypothetical protein